jgi:glycosyltransferase involved in cell wall biosynthesis
MYLLPIHVPIYTDGDRRLVTTEWRRSLILLRDSLENRFGPIHLLAPSLPVSSQLVEQTIEELSEEHDGIKLIASFDLRCRARQYWLRERGPWCAQLRDEVMRADVVHSGLDDVYRPIAYAGLQEAIRAGKPTLFVQDTDIVLQMSELRAGTGLWQVAVGRAYGLIFERLCRHAVRFADLSLLKGMTLMRRYGRYAKNARSFHDTSYLSCDIVEEQTLDERQERLGAGRPLRLVYCGRLVARKGVDQSIRIVKLLQDRGLNVEFDVIGHGPAQAALENLIGTLGLTGSVRLLGPLAYGSDLLRRLAGYDGLLFTPLAEDTPRMIFDGYAAGLPLIAYEIEYVRERAAEDKAAVTLPRGDHNASADLILKLSREPQRLAELARQARRAGVYHAADNWYRRRAEWTFEAVDLRRQTMQRR